MASEAKTDRRGAAPTMLVRTDYPAVQRQCATAQQLTAMMTLTAPELEQVEDRRSVLSIGAAIDVSGSMKGQRLALAVETLKFIIDQLKDTDELGIIAYDTNVYERLPQRRMDAAGKAQAHSVADALRAGSATNLCGGLLAAVRQLLGLPFEVPQVDEEEQVQFQGPQQQQCVQQVVQHRAPLLRMSPPPSPPPATPPPPSGLPPPGLADPAPAAAAPPASPGGSTRGKICAVLLLTDGHANHGPREAETVIPRLQQQVGAAGVAVHTFGFGSDHNADLLRAISEVTQGSYYFIEQAVEIKEAFANCLGGLVSVVMQRIVVRCHGCAEGVRVARALTKYPSTQGPDGGVEVRMADLYSGESRDILVELEVAAQAGQSGATEVARWVVQYDDAVSAARGRDVCAATTVTFSDDGAGRGEADVRVDEQRRRLEVVQALEDARGQAARGNLDEARAVLARTKCALGSAPSMAGAYVQGLVGECTQLEEALTSRQEWEKKGSKMANMAMQKHALQRSNAVSAEECDAYSTPWQMSMKSKAKK